MADNRLTDNEIIKALKICTSSSNGCSHNNYTCDDCYLKGQPLCSAVLHQDAIDLINRQQKDNDRIESVLIGVMHFVDKWLDGAELEQDEVNRASAMREKTLQIVEQQQAENERLKNEIGKEFTCFVGEPHKVEHCPYLEELSKAKAEAIKEFADRLKGKYLKQKGVFVGRLMYADEIDNLVKEMVGEE